MEVLCACDDGVTATSLSPLVEEGRSSWRRGPRPLGFRSEGDVRWICRQVTVTLGSLHMALRGAGLTVITMGSHVLNLHVSVYDGRMDTRKKREKDKEGGRKKKEKKRKKKKEEKKGKKRRRLEIGFWLVHSLPAI